MVDSFYIERRCGNEDCPCKKKIEAKFCPECGKQTVNIKVPTKVEKEYCPENVDLYEHFDLPHAGGVEMSGKYDMLIDNEMGYRWNENSMGQWMATYIDKQPPGSDENIYPGNVIKAFKEKHAEVISKLEENGAQMEFYYGVVVHGS